MDADAVHVLLLEDNPADARLLAEMLRQHQGGTFIVKHVTRVAELTPARVTNHSRAFDVVLVDLTLPDCTGLDTVTRVRAAFPDTAVVVLTGRQDEAAGLDALRAGVQDYLVKGEFDGRTAVRSIRYAIERQRAHQLGAAKDAAEAANRAKDLFLAMVGHDLRAPLSAIRLSAELLRRQPLDWPEVRELAQQIVTCAAEQARLIDDLLDGACLTHGTLRLCLEPIDLADVVRASLAMAKPVADARGVALRAEGTTRPLQVNGDPARLRQDFSNLIGNALKFTARDGHVRVVLERAGSAARVWVIDDGCGIDPAMLEHVFERFWQAKHSESAGRRGLGLGMAIARGIVELHGGQLRASSAGLGQGATFTLELPLATSADAPAPPAQYTPIVATSRSPLPL